MDGAYPFAAGTAAAALRHIIWYAWRAGFGISVHTKTCAVCRYKFTNNLQEGSYVWLNYAGNLH